MNRKYLIQLVMLISLIASHTMASAQDLKTDLKLMHEYYMTAPSFNYSMNIEIYDHSISSSPSIKKKAVIRKKGMNFFYSIDGVEMLMTDKSVILANTQQQNMVYRSVSKKEHEVFAKSIATSSLDSAIKDFSSSKYIGNENGLMHYSISTPDKAIIKTDLYLNKDKSIAKITYFYNERLSKEAYKVNVSFVILKEDKEDAGFWTETRYVKKIKNKFTPTGIYSNYHLSIASNE